MGGRLPGGVIAGWGWGRRWTCFIETMAGGGRPHSAYLIRFILAFKALALPVRPALLLPLFLRRLQRRVQRRGLHALGCTGISLSSLPRVSVPGGVEKAVCIPSGGGASEAGHPMPDIVNEASDLIDKRLSRSCREMLRVHGPARASEVCLHSGLAISLHASGRSAHGLGRRLHGIGGERFLPLRATFSRSSCIGRFPGQRFSPLRHHFFNLRKSVDLIYLLTIACGRQVTPPGGYSPSFSGGVTKTNAYARRCWLRAAPWRRLAAFTRLCTSTYTGVGRASLVL